MTDHNYKMGMHPASTVTELCMLPEKPKKDLSNVTKYINTTIKNPKYLEAKIFKVQVAVRFLTLTVITYRYKQ